MSTNEWPCHFAMVFNILSVYFIVHNSQILWRLKANLHANKLCTVSDVIVNKYCHSIHCANQILVALTEWIVRCICIFDVKYRETALERRNITNS